MARRNAVWVVLAHQASRGFAPRHDSRMPSPTPTACLRCQGPMTAGFLVEHVRMPATPEAQMWVAGHPRRGMFAALVPMASKSPQTASGAVS